eukprot:scaffold10833_cov114-Skeletonema_marinoi.AAC.10
MARMISVNYSVFCEPHTERDTFGLFAKHTEGCFPFCCLSPSLWRNTHKEIADKILCAKFAKTQSEIRDSLFRIPICFSTRKRVRKLQRRNLEYETPIRLDTHLTAKKSPLENTRSHRRHKWSLSLQLQLSSRHYSAILIGCGLVNEYGDTVRVNKDGWDDFLHNYTLRGQTTKKGVCEKTFRKVKYGALGLGGSEHKELTMKLEMLVIEEGK